MTPNLYRSEDFNLIDFPGDNDVRGSIVELVEIISTKKVIEKLKSFKILFVVSESSFGPEGGYGRAFKETIDDKSNFIDNFNQLK